MASEFDGLSLSGGGGREGGREGGRREGGREGGRGEIEEN